MRGSQHGRTRPGEDLAARRGAFDPRLLRHARAARAFIAVCVVLGCVTALLVVAQAWLLAEIVAESFAHGRGLESLGGPLAALLAVVLARAAVAWTAELASARASAQAKSELRGALLHRGSALAARSAGRARSGEVAMLASRGIDALDEYFSLYLPQLLLAVIVPVAVVGAVLADDWISGVIIAFTIPLIPIFMALVGSVTRERTERQLRALERLAGHFLDVVRGLPTLKLFGRSRAQIDTIARISDLYRTSTLATLRVTFLSSLVLELLGAMSVALVAVAIGIRLMDGGLGLRTGLFALVLAPEAYLPLRRLGASYHASAEGLAAAEQAFSIIEIPTRSAAAGGRCPDLRSEPLVLEEVTVTYPERTEPAVQDVSFSLEPGEAIALVGPSGCGKSTVLAVILGLVDPVHGSARVGASAIAQLDQRTWHSRLAWVPQRPHLFRASVAENVRVGRSDASDEEVGAAIRQAGLVEVVRRLPQGMHTVLGEGGTGLSAGERRRLALARALLRDVPLMLLDEPTAGLDGDTERAVVGTLSLLARSRTLLVVSHRQPLLELCDRTLQLEGQVLAA